MPCAPPPPDPAARDPALDAVKGLLVVAMVVYHAMNYFSTAGAGSYGPLRFLNGAFVFLAGFVCAMRHGAGPSDRLQRTRAARRLWQRGLRLLALFTALNLAMAAAGVTSYKQVSFGIGAFLGDLGAIYATGDSPRIAFRILVAIAYTLMLAAAFVAFERARPALVAGTAAAAALYTVVLPFAPLPYFVLVGLCGVCLGLAGGARALAGPRAGSPGTMALHVALGLTAVAAMNVLSGNVLAYGAGIALVLRLLNVLASRLDAVRPAQRCAELLGRYALLGYVGQIGLLFVLWKALGGPRWPPGAELLLVCTATTLLLLALCLAVSRLRTNLHWVDRGYRAVFG